MNVKNDIFWVGLVFMFVVFGWGVSGCNGDSSENDDIQSQELEDTGSDSLVDIQETESEISEDSQHDETTDTVPDEIIDTVADEGPEVIEIREPTEVDPDYNVLRSDYFSVRGSVEQIHIWNAEPDREMVVFGPEGDSLHTGVTDYQGSLVVREVEPGDGYKVAYQDDPDSESEPFEVVSVEGSYPDSSFYYDQVLSIGYGYIMTRDGTLLSVFVSLPGPPEDGPYPTIVNYSGYSPSKPGEPIGGAADLFCDSYPVLCDAPDFPSGLISSLIGNYAVVGINMRGTACSGGTYDYFEPLQLLDGYDIIEIVASQDWVLNHKVGMTGLSFPGISQLFVASTRPPSLAAIVPLSVIANTATSTLIPGGIYNNGFAMEWLENVLDKARPYGHGWEQSLVDEGDTMCEEHQKLHSQKRDMIQIAYDNPYYTDELTAPLCPTTFVDQIEVPVFLGGLWQDEQTGPHFPALFDRFTNSPAVRFQTSNGVHADGFAPQFIIEWMAFLDFYIAGRIPHIPDELRMFAGMMMEEVFGTPLDFPENRFSEYTDFDEALAAYEAEPMLKIIFESGAAPGVEAGAPEGTFEIGFNSWPIEETQARRWYFQPDGMLGDSLPTTDGGASSFEHEADAGQRVVLSSGSVDRLQPNYDYRQMVDGKAVVFISEPLEEDLVMVGHGSVDLWFKSTADDADLEINLTEVRPDGNENYIQSGWLRASQRGLREDATELRPIKTHREEDLEFLVPGEWTEVRVELMPFGHIFRAGSQIRISVDTPGDSRASWRFLLLEYGLTPVHTIGHSEEYPSSIVLPVIPDIEIPTELPDCNALRGQPCRLYEVFTNTPAE